MRILLVFLFIISGGLCCAQQQKVPGKIINALTGKPLAYAKVEIGSQQQLLAKVNGQFSFSFPENEKVSIRVSYLGFKPRVFEISSKTKLPLLIQLYPSEELLNTVYLQGEENKANQIIEKVIENRERNDPYKALNGFSYKSYTKFIIDNYEDPVQITTDTTNSEIATIVNSARAYLSEKVTKHVYSQKQGEKEHIIGLSTAGFKKPVYDVLTLDLDPTSFYNTKYTIYKTNYAGPLAKNSLKNYQFKILDTLENERPAYLLYFKPKRKKVVAGLEGLIYIDTLTYGIQKTESQLIGKTNLQITENYKLNNEHSVWVLKSRDIKMRPGTGNKDISIFGGNISLGTIQRRNSLSSVFNSDPIQPNLYLDASTTNFEFKLDTTPKISYKTTSIYITDSANVKNDSFWEENRKQPFTAKDKATANYVDSIIKAKNIAHKIEVKKTMANGYYPLSFWDLELSKLIKYNNYEGLRLGFGGKTNNHFSEKFNIGGFFVYGFGDQKPKYNLNTSIFLNKETKTSLKFGYTKDIKEVASFRYLKEPRKFYLIEPRFVNINFFYNAEAYYAAITRQVTPALSGEFRFSKTDISNTRDYQFTYHDQSYSNYTISTASLALKWEPFNNYLKTPEGTITVDKKYPTFSAEIDKAFADVAGGDFNFIRTGLKIEHQIKQLDLSRTEIILEGNYATGTLPLTHTFHAYPNSSRQEAILKRFSIAGRTSFETMYYNEFYSDRLAMLHIRHQLRPIKISSFFQPEIVFISRHAIGDIKNKSAHQNIEFKSLSKGYSEFGLEINKIISGFGLSAAYRYGSYHLPTFNQNLSLKFTLNIKF
ncbi:DUF5686 family protein [Zunongwangia sp.]|uniref:DUF5686 family protein n=1 Tax=Zunongwangia sp. TaxID=1965325 RepID=UPI003AA8B061